MYSFHPNSGFPKHHGKYWPLEEDEVLCQENIEGMPIKKIAKIHQRTEKAINLRLIHISNRLLKEHKSKEDISNITGLSIDTIRDIDSKDIFQEILDCLLRIENQLKK